MGENLKTGNDFEEIFVESSQRLGQGSEEN